MFFKSLEIHGFKSFADKTVLNFDAQTTAVVGSNGNGKSNISDALRWDSMPTAPRNRWPGS